MQNLLLILGDHSGFILKQIWMLSAHFREIQVHFLNPNESHIHQPFSPIELGRIYRYFAYLNGAYEDLALELPYPPVFHARENLDQMMTQTEFQSIWVSPTDLFLEEIESEPHLDLVISDAAQACLTQLATIQLEPQEAPLLDLFNCPTPPALPKNWFESIRECALYWANLPESDWLTEWKDKAGRWYRALQDMSLWQSGGMDRIGDLRTPLITPLIKSEKHWGCKLALLLFKRIYKSSQSIDPYFQSVIDFYFNKNGKHLTLLPPPSSFKVTFLILTYNRKMLLERVVNSVLQQTNPNWELLILDHGSTDQTPEYCQSLAKKYPQIRIIRKEKNLGSKQAGPLFQEMIEMAQTELISFTSDDDWYTEDYLDNVISIMQKYPWLASCTGVYFSVDNNSRPTFQYGPYSGDLPILETQLELQRIGTIGGCMQGYLQRKSILKELAQFDPIFVPQLPGYALWDYLLAVKLVSGYEVGYSKSPLIFITIAETSAWTGQQPDVCAELLSVLYHLYQDYCELFGSHQFPLVITEKYDLPRLLNNFGVQLNKAVMNAESVEAFQSLLPEKIAYWENFVLFKNTLIQKACSADAPILVNLQNAYQTHKAT